jgi:CRISPR-associated protein Csh1
MGDIIKTLSTIGTHYLEDEKRVKNKAFEYTKIKVYLFDIETKQIEPYTTIKNEDLIITRFGVGANSGNLFPNMFFEPKNVKKEFDKFVRGTLKANKNLLSYLSEEEINENEILKVLSSVDEAFFADEDKMEEIQGLSKYEKAKGEKGKFTTYFSLSYKNKPISAYFKKIYAEHLNKSDVKTVYGYDIVTNEEGVGGDANLAFCSVDNLPPKLKPIKSKLLPLSSSSAKKVKIGFDVMDKMLSHNFYGLKMAIMPTILSSDDALYGKILRILEKAGKGEVSEIEKSEAFLNIYLESVAKGEAQLPVLNTILFYNKNNSAIDVLLQVDDVLPSYISHVSKTMKELGIKAFKNKDDKDAEGTIYLQKIIDDRLNIMNLLLSAKRIDKNSLIEKFAQLIYWGNSNMKYAYPVDWEKYFNGFYKDRKIDVILRYLSLFGKIDKLKEQFILQKEMDLEEINKKDSTKVKQEKRVKNIDESFEKSVFVQQNEVLETAYLLGMYSQALINWQKGVNQSNNSSYAKWLNGSNAINQSGLNRVWDKAFLASQKIESTSKGSNYIVNYIKEKLLEYMPKMMMSKEIAKSSEVSLAFAMGGSDYVKSTKEKKEA